MMPASRASGWIVSGTASADAMAAPVIMALWKRCVREPGCVSAGQSRALSSGGERFPDTEEVRGSNPLAPTDKGPGHGRLSHIHNPSRSLLALRKVAEKLPCRPTNESEEVRASGVKGPAEMITEAGQQAEAEGVRAVNLSLSALVD
jgi:hypothetical protein